jgi:glycosyltransferase involved in cell wall biosynthesis
MARQWIGMGHEVHVGTCFPNHPTGVLHSGYEIKNYQPETLQGIHVHRTRTYITPNKGMLKKTLGHASFWLSARRHILPNMPRPDATIGTSPTFFAAMAARASAAKHRVPFIMEVRDLWPAIFVDLGVLKNHQMIALLERWEMNLYRSATRIVTVTESFRRDIARRGIPTERIVTVPNGADTDTWKCDAVGATKLRATLGLNNSFVVLYIGAHGISQGLSAIIDAAARVETNSKIQFVFVGEGAEREKLQRRVKEKSLKNIRFLEPVDRRGVQAFYSMADLCLVPLRNIPLFDAFIPSKMFEIMSVGRPILASLRGEPAEILRRSGSAEIVEPEDAAAIATAVQVLASDTQRLRQMGDAGSQFVRREYSRAILARRYIEVIKDAQASFAR